MLEGGIGLWTKTMIAGQIVKNLHHANDYLSRQIKYADHPADYKDIIREALTMCEEFMNAD
jgi:hypothetical protein